MMSLKFKPSNTDSVETGIIQQLGETGVAQVTLVRLFILTCVVLYQQQSVCRQSQSKPSS